MNSTPGTTHSTRTRLFSTAAVMLLAWGALAFGAEYSWAYAPLLVFSAAVGVLGLLASRASVGTLDGTTVLLKPDEVRLKPDATTASVTWAPGLVFLAGLLQLVPLPQGAVAAMSPAGAAADYRQPYAEATMRAPLPQLSTQEREKEEAEERDNGARPLSISPARTALGLVFLAAFGLLFAGGARAVSALGPQAIVRGVVALGAVVLAFVLVVAASWAEWMR